VPAEGDKGGVTLITKKTKHPQRPGSSVNKVSFGGNKTTRKCVKLKVYIPRRYINGISGPTRALSAAPQSQDTDLISELRLFPVHLPSVCHKHPRRMPQRRSCVAQRRRRPPLRRMSNLHRDGLVHGRSC
jgi:hypothetical protein